MVVHILYYLCSVKGIQAKVKRLTPPTTTEIHTVLYSSFSLSPSKLTSVIQLHNVQSFVAGCHSVTSTLFHKSCDVLYVL